MINGLKPVIYWLREDLRFYDNIALTEAAKDNKKVVLVYFSDYLEKKRNSAEGIWNINSFIEISEKYKKNYGIDIQYYDCDPKKQLSELHKKFGITEVYINEIFDPVIKKKDNLIKNHFAGQINFNIFNSNLLFDPESIKNNSGSYFKVYTPFWKN